MLSLLELPLEILISIFDIVAWEAPTTLLCAQRVCNKFKEVCGSTKIQQELYILPRNSLPDPKIPTINPLLTASFPLFFDLFTNLDFAWNHNVGSAGDPYEFHNSDSVTFCPPWSPDSSTRSRWRRPEASWRRLMLTHHPITRMTLACIRENTMIPTWIDFHRIDLERSEASYLTMGIYYDILMIHCGKGFHEHGGFTLFPYKAAEFASVTWPKTSLYPDFCGDIRAEIEKKLADAPTECVLMNFGFVSVRELDPATYGKPVKEYVPDPIQKDKVPEAVYLGGARL